MSPPLLPQEPLFGSKGPLEWSQTIRDGVWLRKYVALRYLVALCSSLRLRTASGSLQSLAPAPWNAVPFESHGRFQGDTWTHLFASPHPPKANRPNTSSPWSMLVNVSPGHRVRATHVTLISQRTRASSGRSETCPRSLSAYIAS